MRSYLAAIAAGARAGEFFNVRYRVGDDGMGQLFERVERPEAVISRALMLCPTTDVYLGCMLRRRRAGGRDAVAESAVLWADCDTPEAVAALERFDPAPAIVIASGSGNNRHAYWPLTDRAPDGQVELANRRIAQALGADPGSVTRPAALLRPPGTLNHKHTPTAPVKALVLDPRRRMALETIVDGLPELEVEVPAIQGPHTDQGSDPLRDIPPPIYVVQLTGRTVNRTGWARCPFHDDEGRPNLRAYPTPQQGWCCFSSKCAGPGGRPRGGSIYDLAGPLLGYQLRGSEFIELKAKLHDVFGLQHA